MEPSENRVILYRIIISIILVGCAFWLSCGDEGDMETPPINQPPASDDQMPVENGDDIPDNNGVEDGNGDIDPQPVALPGLPDFTAGYERWLQLNAEPIPPNDGGDPHRGTKNVFVNQAREVIAPGGQQAFPYPDGCIVVKESVRPDKDFVGLIATMRKIEGADPAHNDWVFEEYTRNAADEPFRKIADGAVCWGCHSAVANADYVYTRLE